MCRRGGDGSGMDARGGGEVVIGGMGDGRGLEAGVCGLDTMVLHLTNNLLRNSFSFSVALAVSRRIFDS